MTSDGLVDECDCQPAAGDLIWFDDNEREKKQGKRFKGEDSDENQIDRKRKKKNNGEIKKKSDGENEFCFRGVNQGFLATGLESERMRKPPLKETDGFVTL